MDLENKILEVLKHFASVDRATLEAEVLRGRFSFAAQKEFERALIELKNSGKIANGNGLFGRFWLTRELVRDRAGGSGSNVSSKGRRRAAS